MDEMPDNLWSNPTTAVLNLVPPLPSPSSPTPSTHHKVWMSGCWIQAAIYFAQRCQHTRVCAPACWIAISRLSWQFVVDGIKHFLTRPDTLYYSPVECGTEGYTTLTPLGREASSKWLRLPLHLWHKSSTLSSHHCKSKTTQQPFWKLPLQNLLHTSAVS